MTATMTALEKSTKMMKDEENKSSMKTMSAFEVTKDLMDDDDDDDMELGGGNSKEDSDDDAVDDDDNMMETQPKLSVSKKEGGGDGVNWNMSEEDDSSGDDSDATVPMSDDDEDEEEEPAAVPLVGRRKAMPPPSPKSSKPEPAAARDVSTPSTKAETDDQEEGSAASSSDESELELQEDDEEKEKTLAQKVELKTKGTPTSQAADASSNNDIADSVTKTPTKNDLNTTTSSKLDDDDDSESEEELEFETQPKQASPSKGMTKDTVTTEDSKKDEQPVDNDAERNAESSSPTRRSGRARKSTSQDIPAETETKSSSTKKKTKKKSKPETKPASSSSLPEDDDLVQSIDFLFVQADVETVTVADICRALEAEYDCLLPKATRKVVRKHLVELIMGKVQPSVPMDEKPVVSDQGGDEDSESDDDDDDVAKEEDQASDYEEDDGKEDDDDDDDDFTNKASRKKKKAGKPKAKKLTKKGATTKRPNQRKAAKAARMVQAERLRKKRMDELRIRNEEMQLNQSKEDQERQEAISSKFETNTDEMKLKRLEDRLDLLHRLDRTRINVLEQCTLSSLAQEQADTKKDQGTTTAATSPIPTTEDKGDDDSSSESEDDLEIVGMTKRVKPLVKMGNALPSKTFQLLDAMKSPQRKKRQAQKERDLSPSRILGATVQPISSPSKSRGIRQALRSRLKQKQRKMGNMWLARELGYKTEQDHLKDCQSAANTKREQIIKLEQSRVKANERQQLKDRILLEEAGKYYENDDKGEVDPEALPAEATEEAEDEEMEQAKQLEEEKTATLEAQNPTSEPTTTETANRSHVIHSQNQPEQTAKEESSEPQMEPTDDLETQLSPASVNENSTPPVDSSTDADYEPETQPRPPTAKESAAATDTSPLQSPMRKGTNEEQPEKARLEKTDLNATEDHDHVASATDPSVEAKIDHTSNETLSTDTEKPINDDSPPGTEKLASVDADKHTTGETLSTDTEKPGNDDSPPGTEKSDSATADKIVDDASKLPQAPTESEEEEEQELELTDEPIDQRDEPKKDPNRPRNAAWQEMLKREAEKVKKMKKRKGGLVEDQAEEEEEEEVAGLEDFGFSVKKKKKDDDDDETPGDDELDEDDLKHVVDEVSDNEGDEEAGDVARQKADRREEKERHKEILRRMREGYDGRRGGIAGGGTTARGVHRFDELVAADNREDAKRLGLLNEDELDSEDEADGKKEKADDEDDEVALLDKMLKDRFLHRSNVELEENFSDDDAEEQAETITENNDNASEDEEDKAQEKLAKRFSKRARMQRLEEMYADSQEFSQQRMIDEDEEMKSELKNMKNGLIRKRISSSRSSFTSDSRLSMSQLKRKRSTSAGTGFAGSNLENSSGLSIALRASRFTKRRTSFLGGTKAGDSKEFAQVHKSVALSHVVFNQASNTNSRSSFAKTGGSASRSARPNSSLFQQVVTKGQ